MTKKINKPKFAEKDLVEFKDYQELKNYTGIIYSVIHSSTDPLNEYTYVLDNVNYGKRERFVSGLRNSVQVVEKNIIRKLELLTPDFLLRNGWFLSTHQNHPQNFYIKNKYPIAFQFDSDNDQMWAYNIENQLPGGLFFMDPIYNEKEYDELVIPFLISNKEIK